MMVSAISQGSLMVCLGALALQVGAVEVECGNIKDDEFTSGFAEIRKLAVQTNTKLCQTTLAIDTDREQLFRATMLDFSASARKLIYESFSEKKFGAIGEQFDRFDLRISRLDGDFDSDKLERMHAGVDFDENGVLAVDYFFDLSDSRGKIGADLDGDCRKVSGSKEEYADCEHALNDVSSAFNAYRHSYDQYRYSNNEEKLSVLSAQWDKFLTEARGQTLLDVLATTWMHRKHYGQDRLVAPAATQYFLLRPQIVYEYVNGASKGDKERLALALEWIGINWWNTKIPFGISLISVYSDQANQDSVASGVLLTLNNKYSFGVTRRDDNTGIIVTLDLVKLMQDKNEQLERYKSKF